MPRPPPVVSSACLQAVDTSSQCDSRHFRTSPRPCFRPAQYFGISVLQAIATGPRWAKAPPPDKARASATTPSVLTYLICFFLRFWAKAAGLKLSASELSAFEICPALALRVLRIGVEAAVKSCIYGVTVPRARPPGTLQEQPLPTHEA